MPVNPPIASGFTEWLHAPIAGIEIWRYLASALVLMLAFFLRRLFEVAVLQRLVKFLSTSPLRYDALVMKALGPPCAAFMLVGGVHAALWILAFRLELKAFDPASLVGKSFLLASGVVAVWAGLRLVDVLATWLDDVFAAKDSSIRGQFMPIIRQSLRVFALIVGGLTLLATLDVDVAGLIAGLGIGGVAIALAAQETFANFLGTFSLLADRPFKVGDWIQAGDKVDGIVEEIGLRSTRIRTWPRTLMSVPNKVLSAEIIDNWSLMAKRRVKMSVGLTYDTPPDKMREFLQRVKRLLREDPDVDQETIIVRFMDFGASSLDVFLCYFTKTTAWDEHLAIRERVNLAILETVESMKLSLAFPTRTVHLAPAPPNTKPVQTG